MIVLPLTYLGSTGWFSSLLAGDCVVDPFEPWIKQTERNRCTILSANGSVLLTVPVVARDGRRRTGEVRIDYSKRWQHQHWMSLVSAYRNSPYFDYFAERFEPFYRERWELLADYDLALVRLCLELMGVSREVPLAEAPVVLTAADTDLRPKQRKEGGAAQGDPVCWHPARWDEHPLPAYTQVFADRFGFVPGLSIIDLVCCEGPRAVEKLIPHRY